jgi:hypothetical protein
MYKHQEVSTHAKHTTVANMATPKSGQGQASIRRSGVQLSALQPAILRKTSRGFAQPFQANARELLTASSNKTTKKPLVGTRQHSLHQARSGCAEAAGTNPGRCPGYRNSFKWLSSDK